MFPPPKNKNIHAVKHNQEAKEINFFKTPTPIYCETSVASMIGRLTKIKIKKISIIRKLKNKNFRIYQLRSWRKGQGVSVDLLQGSQGQPFPINHSSGSSR